MCIYKSIIYKHMYVWPTALAQPSMCVTRCPAVLDTLWNLLIPRGPTNCKKTVYNMYTALENRE